MQRQHSPHKYETSQPVWDFTPQSSSGSNSTFNPTWTWYVPQEAYPSGGTGNGEIAFNAIATLVCPGV
ncbi:hypothetical protein [Alloacidobacterium sp.]|uniref:hypothetical protein n=1 Tax=Alloacidobacterium sp. TaxID=2951999 RepID=UPI002D2AE759|nr:hypothetical protein [Alloacidobacterium sp.]HYK36249.1 hypothetical protein [Alloacidobacterium sp.]